jgi:hypothetical protein
MQQIEGCIITDMSMTLAKALRTGSSPCVAFIGAGGKTTALFQLARQLPAPVIVTATSHLGIWQIPFADKHMIIETPGALAKSKTATWESCYRPHRRAQDEANQ